MAKRRRRATASRTTTKIVRVGSAAPIVRVTAPRAIVRRRARRSSGGGGRIAGGLISNESVQMAIGGLIYGFARKSGIIEKLPALPLIGRTGTAAIVLDYFARHGGGQLALRASRAAAAISGYMLGMEGSIAGDANEYISADDVEGYEVEP